MNNYESSKTANGQNWDMSDVKFAGAEKTTNITSIKDFYEGIKNPIQDDSAINSIIEAYSHREDTFDDCLYGELSKIGVKDKKIRENNPADYQKFEETMFGKWRSSLVDMTKQEFLLAKQQGTLDEDFSYLRSFVKNHPDCHSSTDLRTTIAKIEDKKVAEWMSGVLNKYDWVTREADWTHVKSRRVNARQEDEIKADHRFYLNTDSTDTYACVNALVETYDKNNLPYYFKFSPNSDRADTIVIYTSTKDLMKNLNILEQVQQEYPELASRIHQPPVLTGKIGDKIGYGAEPEEEKDSYNSKRTKILRNALDETTASWIERHKEDVIRSDGKTMKFFEYVVDKQKQIEQQLGYGQVNNTQDSSITNRLISKFNSTLQLVRNHSDDIVHPAVITTDKEKYRDVDAFGLKIAVAKLAPEIARHDPNYIQEVKYNIMNRAINTGVDEKFVFDTSTIKKLQAESNKLTPEYEITSNGNVIFERPGDIIKFGETINTTAVDEFPDRYNRIKYEDSAVGIKTKNGNLYYIAEGVFFHDTGKDSKKVDLLRKREADPNFRFPDIKIGAKLPLEKISENLGIPEGDGGVVVKVVCFGAAPSTSGENKTKTQLKKFVHEEIKENEEARKIREKYGQKQF